VIGVGRGGGKLILCGEHAVVHGFPAIAFGVDRGTTVRLTAGDGPTSVASDAADDRVVEALRRVLPAHGCRVEVHTDLPVGRGMGSSAALAVAVVRARADARGEQLDEEAAFEAAMPMEKAFHGNPSGLDVELAIRGGMWRFERGPPKALHRLPLPGWQIAVLDSGEAGDTARMVAGVAAQRPAIDGILAEIGALVGQAIEVVAEPARLGPLLDENQRLLARIGVSTPAIDRIVALARSRGAFGAKLAGAGGGGVVIALAPDPEAFIQDIRAEGVAAWLCRPVFGAADA
jgi:mevalonate kinase